MPAFRVEPRKPYGLCGHCEMYARIWRYGEEIAEEGDGYRIIDGYSICRICLARKIVTIEHNPEDL